MQQHMIVFLLRILSALIILHMPYTIEQVVNKALQKAGNKNKYQYIILTVLCLIFYLDCFFLMGNNFYFMDPVFICSGSEEIVDEKEACPKLNQCIISNDFTIIKQLGLYCDRQNERDVIQSSLSIGSLIGLLLMNFLSDLRGRRTALMIDIFIGILAVVRRPSVNKVTIGGVYARSTFLLTLGSIFFGFSSYSIIVVCYIIASDCCEQGLRQRGTLIMNVFYSLGIITFFFFYNWCSSWLSILVIFMLIPMIGVGIISFILIEQSPNYYLCKKNNKQACMSALTNIACYNGKSWGEVQEIRKFVVESCHQLEQSRLNDHESSNRPGLMKVLKQRKYLKIILLMAIIKGGSNLFFYGIEYAINDIGFNFGVDNLVIGLTEIITTLILTKFVDKMKRKRTLAITFISTALLSFLFIPQFVQKSQILCTLLIVLIRALTTIGYFMIVMFQTEPFPIQIQSVGAGSIEALAQFGSFSAPLLITFAVNTGLEKMAAMGAVLLICLTPLIWLSEPKKQIDSISDEEFKLSLLEDSS